MPRIYSNLQGGLLDTQSVDTTTAGSFTLYSAGFANLPAVASPNTLMITVDPDGYVGAPEIFSITALTAGATSCTATSAQDGTTGRVHNVDEPWVHGFLASDISAISPGSSAQSQTITSGNNLFANSAAWSDFQGGGNTVVPDLTVSNVSASDVLQIGLSWAGDAESVGRFMDMTTRVSGADVNWISGSNSSTTQGVMAWSLNYSSGEVAPSAGGSILYTVQTGDLSSGSVTLRMKCRLSSATSSVLIAANANQPFHRWVINLRH